MEPVSSGAKVPVGAGPTQRKKGIMGREVKRVALDFGWPLNKTWGGYINPFHTQSVKCPVCDGSGASPTARHLRDLWYGYAAFKPEDRGSKPWTPEDAPVKEFAKRNCERSPDYFGCSGQAFKREATRLCALWNGSWCHHLNAFDVLALVQADRLYELTHEWSKDKGWQPKSPKVTPTPEEVNARYLSGVGHDSINQWICVQAECERLGKPCECASCLGEGTVWPSDALKKRAKRWKQTEPPKGDGYQLWETVSEGSPISPVFSTADDLATWLATSEEYSFKKNDAGTSKEQWLKFILGPAWAPSLVMTGGCVSTGVNAI